RIDPVLIQGGLNPLLCGLLYDPQLFFFVVLPTLLHGNTVYGFVTIHVTGKLGGWFSRSEWLIRLPYLSEWLHAYENKSLPRNDLGIWLLNAKDESSFDCTRC